MIDKYHMTDMTDKYHKYHIVDFSYRFEYASVLIKIKKGSPFDILRKLSTRRIPVMIDIFSH